MGGGDLGKRREGVTVVAVAVESGDEGEGEGGSIRCEQEKEEEVETKGETEVTQRYSPKFHHVGVSLCFGGLSGDVVVNFVGTIEICVGWPWREGLFSGSQEKTLGDY